MEGGDRGPIWRTVLAYRCRDWGKQENFFYFSWPEGFT